MSADGRFVAFQSNSTNLVPGDTNFWDDIFLRDRMLASTTRVSVAENGAQAGGPSYSPVLTPDAAAVVFISQATNLVAGTPLGMHAFLKDLASGAVEEIDVASNGTPGDSAALGNLAASATAQFVAFTSLSTNLVVGDTNGVEDVFLRDTVGGTTVRLSVGPGGVQANGGSRTPSLSTDGRFLAFESDASNLVANDTNEATDIFVVDRVTGAVQPASRAADGTLGNDFSQLPRLSADGGRVFFWSAASNLVRRDTNGRYLGFDVFLRAVRW
jgi:Tol biopolymer transport system component